MAEMEGLAVELVVLATEGRLPCLAMEIEHRCNVGPRSLGLHRWEAARPWGPTGGGEKL